MQHLVERKREVKVKMKANFMEIAFLSKLEKTNINASGTEGNVTILKKTEEIDGTQRIYISGASLKYAIKTYLEENGWKLSEVKSKTKTAQITTECNPKERIDDDLFGYLDTETDKKRVAPVKTNGMISLFPYRGDLNRGVRFDPKGKEHSLYDIEIATNVFRGNWAVELDRIGKGKDWEIPPNEKERRVISLYFGLADGREYDFKQIALFLGCSVRYIKVLFNRGMNKLRQQAVA